MKKFAIVAVSFLTLTAVFFAACSKEDNNNGTTLQVRMTDAPLLVDEVNVEIQLVRVKFAEDSIKGWMNLTTYAGVYNLLGLQNGVDTLLATGNIPTSEVKEIRFLLGTNNSIKVAGVTYPLTIPSGADSGLKIKVDKKLNGTLDSLIIDFDAALSIKFEGGEYHLRPVLKIKS